MTIRFLYTLPVIIILMLWGASTALAQTDTTTTIDAKVVAEVEDLASQAAQTEPTYEGIEVEAQMSVPSRMRLFWRNMRERVSVALTFNPTEKAEKAVKYADEHLLLAERLFENAQSERVRRQAFENLEKAKAWMERLRTSQEQAVEQNDQNLGRLLRNRATQFERQRRIMDRIEEKANDKQDRILEFREQLVEEHRRLENAIENENIPEDVRRRLEKVSERIETHAQQVREDVREAQALRETAKAGDEEAQGQLEQFRERRQEAIRVQREQREKLKEEFEEKFDTKLDELFSKSEKGDENAAAFLERIKNNPELRRRLNNDLQGEAREVEETNESGNETESNEMSEERRIRAERIKQMLEAERTNVLEGRRERREQ